RVRAARFQGPRLRRCADRGQGRVERPRGVVEQPRGVQVPSRPAARPHRAARGRLMVHDLLRRWFLENVALKTVALVLAVTLFIRVRGEKETERSVKVRIAYIKPDDRVLVSDVPQTVDVWVRGPWTRIKRLDTDDIDPLVVDLTKVGDGQVTLDESSVRL